MDNNDSLNPRPGAWGYTVFGTVLEGLDVLQKIADVETDYSEHLDAQNVPVNPVMLIKVSVQ